jgi:hypothetical protein
MEEGCDNRLCLRLLLKGIENLQRADGNSREPRTLQHSAGGGDLPCGACEYARTFQGDVDRSSGR